MGNTVPLPRYGCCVPRSSYVNNYSENPNSAPRVKVCHRRNISATFHVSDGTGASGPVQLNVNTASEEELMTLPGINRDTARNIVDYRRQIGRFKKVEDVALVSGVGATKLALIRPEICVSERASMASSLSSSQVDMSATAAAPALGATGDSDSRLSGRSGGGSLGCAANININQANVFQLMKVRGGLVTQQLAENIVAHRDRKGPFKTVDDLLKVKGISEPLLGSLRAYVTVSEEVSVPLSTCVESGDGPLSPSAVGVNELGGEQLSSLLNVVKLLGKSEEDIMFHVGPLAHQSFRRSRHAAREPSLASYPSWAGQAPRRVLRAASWNVEQCTADKAANPGVREVLAMTLLENKIDVVALQDVSTAALSKFRDELNHPTIPNVRKWSKVDSSLTWAHISGAEEDKLAFLFRSDRLSDVQHSTFRSETVDCLFIKFKVHSTEQVTCVNVHCKNAAASSEQDLNSLLKQLSDFAGQSMVIVTGDFPTNSRLTGVMLDNRMCSVLTDNMFTDISTDLPEGSVNNVSLLFTEHGSTWTLSDNEVVREGLTSPWIPNGWGWGGLASHHCPTWAEFTHNASLLDTMSAVNGGGRKRPSGVAGHRS